MDSVMKGLMGAMLPQNSWARTAPVNLLFILKNSYVNVLLTVNICYLLY